MKSQTKRDNPARFVWRLIGPFSLCLVLQQGASAQQPEKVKNDPTYSTHNYKHPNKAAAARAWESEITLSRRERRQVRVGDYKRPANVEPETRRMVFTPRRNRKVNPEVMAGYNYKNPRPTTGSTGKELAKPARPTTVAPEEEPTGN